MLEIKKGDMFFCRRTMIRHGKVLFKKGISYNSSEDHSITAENELNYCGFNKEMLQRHFARI